MHHTLEQVIRSLASGEESASTGKSPHEIVYGHAAVNPFATLL